MLKNAIFKRVQGSNLFFRVVLRNSAADFTHQILLISPETLNKLQEHHIFTKNIAAFSQSK